MATYKVVQRIDSGDVIVAVIRDGEVTGRKAEIIRAALEEEHWEPGTDPRNILHGSYLFAVLVPDDEA
jgi:hypothetical protein